MPNNLIFFVFVSALVVSIHIELISFCLIDELKNKNRQQKKLILISLTKRKRTYKYEGNFIGLIYERNLSTLYHT